MHYWQWLMAHKALFGEVSGAAYVALNVLNGLLPHSNKFLRRAIDVSSWLTNHDSPGTLKAPFKRSRTPHPKAEPKAEEPTPVEKK